MEFGDRINTKHLLAAAAFTLILFTIALDLVFLSMLKDSYEDTKSMIATIAESGISGEDLIQYLKEAPDENWLLQGKEFLSFYGYDESAKTVWDEKYLAALKTNLELLSSEELTKIQQQRVAIARALAAKPDIILADEPTGNLDSKTSMEVVNLLKVSVRKCGQTLAMITHDEELSQIADRILIIDDGVVTENGKAVP